MNDELINAFQILVDWIDPNHNLVDIHPEIANAVKALADARNQERAAPDLLSECEYILDEALSWPDGFLGLGQNDISRLQITISKARGETC